MAKSQNQKLKLLYIIKILQEHSDEEHPITTKTLIEKLETYGIVAERKSIYDDMACLEQFGYDIICKKSKTDGGYFLGERMFELAELKLLVDAVQASKFITLKKSQTLIKKLETLVSHYDASKLQRQVYVANRIKTINESIFYNVDVIHQAMQQNQKISFQYCEWTVERELALKKSGEVYEVSPFALTFNDDNYYLVGYDSKDQKIKHYRVDKMKSTKNLDSKREGNQLFQAFDIGNYSKTTFGMYGGEEVMITLVCDNHLAGVMIDRFGKDVDIRKLDDSTFRLRVKIALSHQFYGWLTGLNSKAYIKEPEWVKDEYRAFVEQTMRELSKDN